MQAQYNHLSHLKAEYFYQLVAEEVWEGFSVTLLA